MQIAAAIPGSKFSPALRLCHDTARIPVCNAPAGCTWNSELGKTATHFLNRLWPARGAALHASPPSWLYLVGFCTLTLFGFQAEVPGRGLEPLRIAPPDPKSGASANFATPAYSPIVALKRFRQSRNRRLFGLCARIQIAQNKSEPRMSRYCGPTFRGSAPVRHCSRESEISGGDRIEVCAFPGGARASR